MRRWIPTAVITVLLFQTIHDVALMLAARRFVEEKRAYQPFLHKRVEILIERMKSAAARSRTLEFLLRLFSDRTLTKKAYLNSIAAGLKESCSS